MLQFYQFGWQIILKSVVTTSKTGNAHMIWQTSHHKLLKYQEYTHSKPYKYPIAMAFLILSFVSDIW